MNAYPLTFTPILKNRIWGGTKLGDLLHKPISGQTIGESWELSAVKGDVSVVNSGEYCGTTLAQLIEKFPAELLGQKVYARFGAEFPLLFKFIDAREDLSIQVHPGDQLAKKRHDSFGKTEMWYVMQADPGSRIIVGFKRPSSAQEYLWHLENRSLMDILKEVEAKPGDVFFLETGTVHAIGAGILLAEIQQTSDITYRIYDWDRVDDKGNSRELHVELALDAMNYEVVNARKTYQTNVNEANVMVDCPYFTTSFIPVDGRLERNKTGESFFVYMVVDGDLTLTAGGQDYAFAKGSTVLIPAALTRYWLGGRASVLEVSVL